MFKKSNYDFEIYKELRKLNETINKRGNLDEDTNIKNKLELEYILDNARKYYSEAVSYTHLDVYKRQTMVMLQSLQMVFI